MKINRSLTGSIVIAFAAALLLLGGCGGGGGSVPGTTGRQMGRVSADVRLTGRVAGRMVAATASDTVQVAIKIEGYYSEDGQEFDDITSSLTITLSNGSGYGTVSVTDVPVGVNHLLTATADWGNGEYEVVKAIIPSVSAGQTTRATANENSTAVANAAIYYRRTTRPSIKFLLPSSPTWKPRLLTSRLPRAAATTHRPLQHHRCRDTLRPMLFPFRPRLPLSRLARPSRSRPA